MSAINRINVNSRNGRVTESKADLVAMEASGGEYLIQFILVFDLLRTNYIYFPFKIYYIYQTQTDNTPMVP